jgi:hypothetical protein
LSRMFRSAPRPLRSPRRSIDFHRLRYLVLATAIVSILSMVMVCAGSKDAYAWWMWTPGDTVDNVGYRPTQPIPEFSHKNHAGDRKIPCQYCHSSARRSIVAGIPPLNTCMGCHRLVGTDLEPIKKITKMYQDNQPIPWVKVDDLPDFVRFSHKVHIHANLACQECHGKVEEMSVVEQVAPLQMGWCIGCHRERHAKTDCITCHY